MAQVYRYYRYKKSLSEVIAETPRNPDGGTLAVYLGLNALRNAAACLIPYLPALAASSPLVEGRAGECVDNRLAFYACNQRRIPELTGRVVPEFMRSYAGYRREILAPAYRALSRVRGGKRRCHEWVNSRGAILRFQRPALELRVLDTQASGAFI